MSGMKSGWDEQLEECRSRLGRILSKDSPKNTLLPRLRPSFSDDEDARATLPTASTSPADDFRRSIKVTSSQRAAERTRLWQENDKERQAKILAEAERRLKEAVSLRIEEENAANAEYNLQRMQREEQRQQPRRSEGAVRKAETPERASISLAPSRAIGASSPEVEEPSSSTDSGEQSSPSEPVTSPPAQEDNCKSAEIFNCLRGLQKTMHDLQAVLQNLPKPETASPEVRQTHERYKTLIAEANVLFRSFTQGGLRNSEMLAQVVARHEETKALLQLANAQLGTVSHIKTKGAEAEQRAKLAQQQERKLDVRPEQKIPQPSQPPQSPQKPEVEVKKEPVVSTEERARNIYEHYAEKTKQVRSSFPSLESDPSLKTLKSAVLFASSNPIAICSANSPMEVIEPFRKAFFLLRGAEVDTNSIKFRLSDHPEIVHCARYNMAKKFIDLAVMQTEEKNEVKLFALATFITELWACDREFGETFLALLFTEYPVLIPYYGKPSIKADNVELSLKKIGAISKFYAAIMQTDRTFLLRRLFPTKVFEGRNPHGAEGGWELLAGLANQDIEVGTTVLVLRNTLSIAGWLLKKYYEKQFSKLLIYVSRHMLPKIRERTPKELMGPVERLNELMETYHRTMTIAVPENRLSDDFWQQ
ncbi:hypothetical protein RvY_14493 [Ramazzottius varieornatus]|uniref:mRNA export factor GLE1 n=1 Tax=Ramazzottius varieornatus TaxID=947166 RepID=A0A1D1VWL1_RAMVA|nr:hypothetical protein RvY_14493 [Ramazzottius varieornatus]